MLRLPAAAHAGKRGGLDFTHFVSLPLTSRGLQQQYAQYTAALMADPELASYRVAPQVRGGLPNKPCAYMSSADSGIVLDWSGCQQILPYR